MKMWIICFLMMITGCGHEIPNRINPDFNDYIDEFRKDAKKENVDDKQLDKVTVIDYDDNLHAGGEVAKCYLKRNVEKKYGITLWNLHWHEIKVSYDWKYFNEEKKYKIILHEIGHCAYHLKHNHEDINSIMAPDVEEQNGTFEMEKHLFFMDVLKNMNEWNSEMPL